MSDISPIKKSSYTGKNPNKLTPRSICILALEALLIIALFGYMIFDAVNDRREMLNQYAASETAAEMGDYEAAWRGFTALGDWKDAPQRAEEVEIPMYYQLGVRYYAHGEYIGAIYYFSQCRDYLDSMSYIEWSMNAYLDEKYLESLE